VGPGSRSIIIEWWYVVNVGLCFSLLRFVFFTRAHPFPRHLIPVDSKSKVEVLSEALEAGPDRNPIVLKRGISELCSCLSPCFGDHNVKLSSLASAVVERLCSETPEGTLRGELEHLVAPLTELLGNAKVGLFCCCRALLLYATNS